YALSSLAVTALDIGAFVLFLPLVADAVVTANVLARLVAVVAHFLLSREYVFRVRGELRLAEAIRYGTIVVANLALTTWLLLEFRQWGADVVSAKVLAQLVGFVFTFLVLNRYVFTRPQGARTNW